MIERQVKDWTGVRTCRVEHARCGRYLGTVTLLGSAVMEYDAGKARAQLEAEQRRGIRTGGREDRLAERGIVTTAQRRAPTSELANHQLGIMKPRAQGTTASKNVPNKSMLPEARRVNDRWSWLCPHCKQWTPSLSDEQMYQRFRRAFAQGKPAIVIH